MSACRANTDTVTAQLAGDGGEGIELLELGCRPEHEQESQIHWPPVKESNAIGFARRTSRPNGLLTSRKRACGIDTPLPMPVDPRSSRLVSSSTSNSAGRRRAEDARAASSLSRRANGP